MTVDQLDMILKFRYRSQLKRKFGVFLPGQLRLAIIAYRRIIADGPVLGNSDSGIYGMCSFHVSVKSIHIGALTDLEEKVHLHRPLACSGDILLKLVFQHTVKHRSPVHGKAYGISSV